MKKFFVSFVAIIISLSLAGCTPDSGSGVQNNGSSTTTSAPSTYEYTSTSGRYLLELEYGSNIWSYTVSANLPSPCYNFTVNTMIMESYPERVSINVVESVDSDLVCAQVITPKSLQGTISVSPYATFSLETSEV